MTLGAAALALLSPLQDRLERQAEQSLRTAVITARPQLNDSLRKTRGQLSARSIELAIALYRRTGSRVILTDSAPTLDPYPFDTGAGADSPRDIYRVLATNATVTSTGRDGETRVATLLTLEPTRTGDDWVLAVRNPSEDVAATSPRSARRSSARRSSASSPRSCWAWRWSARSPRAWSACAPRRCASRARAPARSRRATTAATRSATSRARSRRCRRR